MACLRRQKKVRGDNSLLAADYLTLHQDTGISLHSIWLLAKRWENYGGRPRASGVNSKRSCWPCAAHQDSAGSGGVPGENRFRASGGGCAAVRRARRGGAGAGRRGGPRLGGASQAGAPPGRGKAGPLARRPHGHGAGATGQHEAGPGPLGWRRNRAGPGRPGAPVPIAGPAAAIQTRGGPGRAHALPARRPAGPGSRAARPSGAASRGGGASLTRPR